MSLVAAGTPTPVIAFVSAVAGVLAKGAVDVWLAHRAAKIDQTKFGADISPEPAKVLFDAQQAALVMSEQMRHDLRDQVERCQEETAKVKAENDALDERLRTQAEENAAAQSALRARLQSMEDELAKLHKQLEETQ